MSVSIQIRGVPEEIHRTLQVRAAAAGRSLSAYLPGEITRVAERPTDAEVLQRAAAGPTCFGASRRPAPSRQAVRSMDLRGLRDLRDLPLIRVPHEGLVDRMWELRHDLSADDAAFVALAGALDVPLITCDGRLAGSARHRARIELFAT